MIMAASPIYDCYKSLYNEDEAKPHLIYLSPKGKTFTQSKAIELSKLDRIVLLCGHYEGIDERIIEEIADMEISIGDYVLTGGELPAMVLSARYDAVEGITDESVLIGIALNDETCLQEKEPADGVSFLL